MGTESLPLVGVKISPNEKNGGNGVKEREREREKKEGGKDKG